jgi:hypothetical protein
MMYLMVHTQLQQLLQTLSLTQQQLQEHFQQVHLLLLVLQVLLEQSRHRALQQVQTPSQQVQQ